MLSDACSDFLVRLSDAARELARAAHHYAEPESTIIYGEEIDALRRAAAKVSQGPFNEEDATGLIRLAMAVLRFHDTPPDTELSSERERAMLVLVGLLRPSLKDAEAAEVSTMVSQAKSDGEAGIETAYWLRGVLPRLSKPAYDMATKIIGDIGSATVKRLLGL